MSYTTYSAKEVDISFGGAINIDGWSSISIDKNEANSSANVSADGKVAQTILADNTGTFEITVQQQNSNVNMFCAALQSTQTQQNKLFFFDITITDKSGGVLAYLNRAHLNMPSSLGLAAEQTDRTWKFYVEDLFYVPNPSGISETSEDVSKAFAALNTITNNTINK